MISYQYNYHGSWISCDLVKLEDTGDVTISFDSSGIGVFSTETVDADLVKVTFEGE